jgi:hypothetical protein
MDVEQPASAPTGPTPKKPKATGPRRKSQKVMELKEWGVRVLIRSLQCWGDMIADVDQCSEEQGHAGYVSAYRDVANISAETVLSRH